MLADSQGKDCGLETDVQGALFKVVDTQLLIALAHCYLFYIPVVDKVVFINTSV